MILIHLYVDSGHIGIIYVPALKPGGEPDSCIVVACVIGGYLVLVPRPVGQGEGVLLEALLLLEGKDFGEGAEMEEEVAQVIHRQLNPDLYDLMMKETVSRAKLHSWNQ